jgi:two-component system CheB/CheR fusion protein
MPGSAILSGAVDHVLSAAEIASKLARLAEESVRSHRPPHQPSLPPEAADQPVIDRLFEVLKIARKVDFSDYKPSTLRRRITRRMTLRRIAKLADYVDLLRKDPKEIDDLFRDLLINVTSFFRDKAVFRALTTDILPEIIAAKRESDPLRIWIPGCATGEEVYSVGICVSEALAKAKKNLKVQIFGTDLSDWAITRARSGIYSAAALASVSEARKRRFFDLVDANYRIRRSIREMCTFAQQNVCEDPPFSRMDLISCRNVMIYLGPKLQRKCVPLFYYALNPHGFLMLGVSESIGSFADLFTLMDKKHKVYRKKTTPLVSERRIKEMPLKETRPIAALAPKLPRKITAPLHSEKETAIDLQTAADHLILTHFAPCGVVIDTRMQVWHFRGHTSPFLEHAPGAASLNILKLVRHSMAADLSAAIHQSLKTASGVRRECIVTEDHSFAKTVSIEVIPFNVGASPEQWLLVIFEYVPTTIPLPHLTDDGTDSAAAEQIYAREVDRLRGELSATKDSLQCIIEEQEAANEEIKSANEEIESSNEELQSTNEELETAKEELQSTNEELSTVNEELNQRNQEISEINNDLNNLLSSINIAIVMVDNHLTIRRTTPLAEKIFNIIPSDIGRKLTDINPNVEMPTLPKMIRSVIDNLTPVEQKVFDTHGSEYSLRVRPYRTRENVINGVVITLVDINQPSKSHSEGESSS